MSVSTADRQRLYREKIKRGELKRFQFALPLETGIKVDYLCDTLQCNRTELFARLILEEWKRQGEPLFVVDCVTADSDSQCCVVQTACGQNLQVSLDAELSTEREPRQIKNHDTDQENI